MSSTRRIVIIVGLIYFGLSAFMFRGVIAAIPSILRGETVINADELVPFFDVHSQLLDQAAGKFNQLTNGYEFRVRYSFLTTWMRYYKILPFAIVLVIPLTAYAAYWVVAWFLGKILIKYRPEAIYTIAAAPVLVFFLIMTYAKITQFYTLIVGFSLFLIAIVLVSYGLIFPQKRPYKPIIIACVLTLFNPAVHYLVLFALYMALTVATLTIMEAIIVIRNGSWRNIFRLKKWPEGIKILRRDRKRLFNENRFWRSMAAFCILGGLTLAPYAAFVKFYVLRGVDNLSETVPSDYYFIVDASIAPGHLVAFDMAGIMDKFITGDYLSTVPRWANATYTVLMFLPLFFRKARRALFSSEPLRAFMIVAYASTIFSMWATLGYSDPPWMPTFHRTIAFISNYAYGTQSFAGNLVVLLFGTIVGVLRFPHRFQFIMLATACILIPMTLIWIEAVIEESALVEKISQMHRSAGRLLQSRYLPVIIALLAMIPMGSNTAYTSVLFSGNLSNFLAPYPVGPLKEVKDALLRLPPGKVVMLPPTESAKAELDINGVAHKFIDKFHIYYLDLPSYYYGLTGDANNKQQFFLLLRALYYQQGWWVNIARDLNLRYIIINKELVANTVGGQEYLRGMEQSLQPEFDRRSAYLQKVMENESYALYEFTDLPVTTRVPLYIDTDWNSFIQILSNNLALTRYYDLRYSNVRGDLDKFDRLALVTDNPHDAILDLYVKANPGSYFQPSSTIMPFTPNLISSAYYLSPMFRLFQFFSNSKWNRINMITPGLWGTINGSFIGIPHQAQFRIDIALPADGAYRVVLRGAAASNNLAITSKLFTGPRQVTLRSSSDNLSFFDTTAVFSARRIATDIRNYSQDELDLMIPADVVIINMKYQYFDLGTVSGKKGKYTLYFNKTDNTPLLVEGIVVMPESSYTNLSLPANVEIVPIDKLCCTPLIQQP